MVDDSVRSGGVTLNRHIDELVRLGVIDEGHADELHSEVNELVTVILNHYGELG